MRVVYIPNKLPIEARVHPPPTLTKDGKTKERIRPKGVRMVVYLDKIVLHTWR